MVKFAHFADIHIGSWRDPKLNNISMKGFYKSIDICFEKQVDFILISGDFFNTNFPSIDRLKETAKKLKELKEKQIPVYIIPGSHDYSPTGKTMIDVFEQAGLLKNVMKGSIENNKLKLNFTQDPKTQIKITGIAGRKGMLDRQYYEMLDTIALEQEYGLKIFMFHTAITELKPKDLEKMDSAPLSYLPKNFIYYAGGHVHQVIEKNFPNYNNVIFPGPMFPNNFREIEKLSHGGFYFVNIDGGELKKEYIPIEICPTVSFYYKCDNKTPEQAINEIREVIRQKEIRNKIVTLRIEGKLIKGTINDLNLSELVRQLIENQGAYFVMRNTTKLETEAFKEIRKLETDNPEQTIIEEHLSQSNLVMEKEEQKNLALQAIQTLSIEKKEGERISDFEERLLDDLKKTLKIDGNYS